MFFRCVLSIPDSRILAGPRSALTKQATTKRGLIASRREKRYCCSSSAECQYCFLSSRPSPNKPLLHSFPFLSPGLDYKKPSIAFVASLRSFRIYHLRCIPDPIWREKGIKHYLLYNLCSMSSATVTNMLSSLVPRCAGLGHHHARGTR